MKNKFVFTVNNRLLTTYYVKPTDNQLRFLLEEQYDDIPNCEVRKIGEHECEQLNKQSIEYQERFIAITRELNYQDYEY